MEDLWQEPQGKPISALVLSRAVEHATTCLATPRCFVVVHGLNAATGCVFSLIVSAETFQIDLDLEI